MSEVVRFGEGVTLYHGDCMEVLPTLEAGSVDAVLTDPPYGLGIEEWDCRGPCDEVWQHCKRVIRDGFLSVFCQMPMLAEWNVAIRKAGFQFCEHVVWVKRFAVPSARLSRSHESVLIYSAGRRRFHCTHGAYEDVKLPGILVDVMTIEGIDRHIKNLRAKLRGQASSIPAGTRRHTAFGRFSTWGGSDRSPERVNFTNVWSFLPDGLARRDGNHNHPTAKPLAMMERLVEMLTAGVGSVVDPYMGSGTTGVACVRLGRRFIGMEIERRYFEMACERIEAEMAQLRLPLGYEGVE